MADVDWAIGRLGLGLGLYEDRGLSIRLWDPGWIPPAPWASQDSYQVLNKVEQEGQGSFSHFKQLKLNKVHKQGFSGHGLRQGRTVPPTDGKGAG